MKKAKSKKHAWTIAYDLLVEAFYNGTIDNSVDQLNESEYKGDLTGHSQQMVMDAFEEILDSIETKIRK